MRAQGATASVTAVEASPESPEEGASVTLSARVTNAAGRVLHYTWNAGDGTPPQAGDGLASIVHVYGDNGAFRVTVTIDDGRGGVATGSGTVMVLNAAPKITVLAGPAEAARDEPVRLRAVARDPGTSDVLTYRWDFGDGSTTAGVDLREATHRFGQAGVFAVQLVVEDDDGASAARTVMIPVERTQQFEVSGAVNAAIEGGFDHRPGFTVIPATSSPTIPAGTCQLAIIARGDRGDTVIFGAQLPAPLRPGTFRAARSANPQPGVFRVQDMLMCDRPGVDCSGGLWRGNAESGLVTLTQVSPERIAGRLDVGMAFGRESYHLTGSFTAAPSRIVGYAMARQERPCFSSGILAVESLSPAPNRKNVDFDSPEVRVALTEAYDPSTLNDTAFRLEYRLPDVVSGAGTPTEAYAQVDGVLEPTSDRTFRFVPAAALLDGVIYRATVAGGDRGLRGAAGERMDDDRSWRFSTIVQPDGVRVAVYQVAQDTPLVPDKTTLTRVYVDWREKPDVHPDWQVVSFPADVKVEVDGGPVAAYPARTVPSVTRPDRIASDDVVMARNSVNFFGWKPSGTGATSVVSATVTPTGQDRTPPRHYDSAPLSLEHYSASPRLTFEAWHLLVGPWADGVPPALRELTAAIVRDGATFTQQNFPVVDVSGMTGELPASEPFMFRRTDAAGLMVYTNVFETVGRDDYLAKQAYDVLSVNAHVDMLILFMPGAIQPRLAGFTYRFPLHTISVFVPDTIGPQTLLRATGTVAHEFGHAFGLQHSSSCAGGRYQSCLDDGRAGSDAIEGFRLAPDGSRGANKSKREGNAEAPNTHAVLSLMYPDGIGAPGTLYYQRAVREAPERPAARRRRWNAGTGRLWSRVAGPAGHGAAGFDRVRLHRASRPRFGPASPRAANRRTGGSSCRAWSFPAEAGSRWIRCAWWTTNRHVCPLRASTPSRCGTAPKRSSTGRPSRLCPFRPVTRLTPRAGSCLTSLRPATAGGSGWRRPTRRTPPRSSSSTATSPRCGSIAHRTRPPCGWPSRSPRRGMARSVWPGWAPIRTVIPLCTRSTTVRTARHPGAP